MTHTKADCHFHWPIDYPNKRHCADAPHEAVQGLWRQPRSEFAFDEWLRFEWVVRWSSFSNAGHGSHRNGSVQLSIGGSKVIDWTGPIGRNDGGRLPYFKIGVYNPSGIPGKTQVFFRNYSQSWKSDDRVPALLDVRRFGAKPDGITDNSLAFARALKACNGTGGCTLRVPQAPDHSPSRYMLRYLRLVSNMVLELEADIVAPAHLDEWAPEPIVTITNVRNVTVRGPGSIDGRANHNGIWNYTKLNPRHALGGCLVGIANATDVHLCCGLSIRNAPSWHVQADLLQCVDCPQEGGLVMDDITIAAEDAVSQGANGVGGVGIVSSTGRLVHLRNVTIVSEDDIIELSGRSALAPTRNILVERSRFGTGHGCSMHTHVRDVVYRDNVFKGGETGFRIKTHLNDTGVCENISYINTTMVGIGMPFTLNEYYFSNAPAATTSASVSDISIDGLFATLANHPNVHVHPNATPFAGCIFCSRDTPCRRISLKNIHVSASGVSRRPPAFFCHHAFGTAAHVGPTSCLQHGDTPASRVEDYSPIVWKTCTGYPRVRKSDDVAKDARKGVVFMVMDDARPLMSHAFGQTFMKTPNFDRLSRESMVFRHAYCQYAVCGPSRNSFMTGRRESQRTPRCSLFDNLRMRVDARSRYHQSLQLPYQVREACKIAPHESVQLTWIVRVHSFRDTGPKWVSFPQHFKEAGYTALGSGKIYHTNCAPKAWTCDECTVVFSENREFGNITVCHHPLSLTQTVYGNRAAESGRAVQLVAGRKPPL